MLVPVVSAVSTSPSLGNVPPVIATVALAKVRLSGSLSDAVLASVIGIVPSSVYWAVDGIFVSVGVSLTLLTVMVVVWTVLRLFDALPSLSTHVTVRNGLEP